MVESDWLEKRNRKSRINQKFGTLIADQLETMRGTVLMQKKKNSRSLHPRKRCVDRDNSKCL